MREIRQNQKVIFEDRPVVLPGVVIACGLLLAPFALGLIQSGDFTSGEVEWPALLAALAMIAGGAVFLRRDRFEFDSLRKRLNWSKRSLVSHQQGSVPFSEISGVMVEELPATDGTTYRLTLNTQLGLLPLTPAYWSNENAIRQAAARIQELLKLESPAQDSDVRVLASRGRIIDAVRLLRTRDGLDLVAAKAEVDRIRSEANT